MEQPNYRGVFVPLPHELDEKYIRALCELYELDEPADLLYKLFVNEVQRVKTQNEFKNLISKVINSLSNRLKP